MVFQLTFFLVLVHLDNHEWKHNHVPTLSNPLLPALPAI